MVDSWSWLPNIAAQGILCSLTGLNAFINDSGASVALAPNMLSPDYQPWTY